MDKNRMPIYLGVAAVAALVLSAGGVPFTSLLPFVILLTCPLMMIVMMKGMGGKKKEAENHTGHGCEHDPTRPVDAAAPGCDRQSIG